MLWEQMHYCIRLELCGCFYACLIPSVLRVLSGTASEVQAAPGDRPDSASSAMPINLHLKSSVIRQTGFGSP
jgi:hypothetical protein